MAPVLVLQLKCCQYRNKTTLLDIVKGLKGVSLVKGAMKRSCYLVGGTEVEYYFRGHMENYYYKGTKWGTLVCGQIKEDTIAVGPKEGIITLCMAQREY